jgi:addiction module HigA family antidote
VPWRQALNIPDAELPGRCLEPLGMSVSELSRRIGVSRKHLSAVANQKSGVGVDLALRFAEAFRTSPEVWLNAQMKWDLWQARKANRGRARIAPLMDDRQDT